MSGGVYDDLIFGGREEISHQNRACEGCHLHKRGGRFAGIGAEGIVVKRFPVFSVSVE
jgi:hypothetical protein